MQQSLVGSLTAEETPSNFFLIFIRFQAQVERDIRESMAIVESFISNVAAVLQLPPNFVRFDEEWFQVNAVKWEAAFKSLEEAYNTLAQQNR